MQVKKFGGFKNNRFEFFCVFLVIVGIFIGTVGFVTGNEFSLFKDNFLEVGKDKDFLRFDVFIKTFFGNLLFLFVIFICGFSAVLQPLIFACAVCKGMGLGVVASAIYTALGKEAVLQVFVSVVLPSLFVIFAIIIGVREAFYMSVSIAKAIFTEKNFIGLKDAAKLYIVKFVILVALISFGCVVECILKSLIF